MEIALSDVKEIIEALKLANLVRNRIRIIM
jgi:hypothetical protein